MNESKEPIFYFLIIFLICFIVAVVGAVIVVKAKPYVIMPKIISTSSQVLTPQNQPNLSFGTVNVGRDFIQNFGTLNLSENSNSLDITPSFQLFSYLNANNINSMQVRLEFSSGPQIYEIRRIDNSTEF